MDGSRNNYILSGVYSDQDIGQGSSPNIELDANILATGSQLQSSLETSATISFVAEQDGILPRAICPSISYLCVYVEPAEADQPSYTLKTGDDHIYCIDISLNLLCDGKVNSYVISNC